MSADDAEAVPQVVFPDYDDRESAVTVHVVKTRAGLDARVISKLAEASRPHQRDRLAHEAELGLCDAHELFVPGGVGLDTLFLRFREREPGRTRLFLPKNRDGQENCE